MYFWYLWKLFIGTENTNLISGYMYLNSCNILISSSDLVSQDVFIFLLLKPSFH